MYRQEAYPYDDQDDYVTAGDVTDLYTYQTQDGGPQSPQLYGNSGKQQGCPRQNLLKLI